VNTLFDAAASGRLCVTLLHSLWQMTLLAFAAGAISFFLGRNRVSARYWVHAAALFVGVLAMPLTHALVQDDAPPPPRPQQVATPPSARSMPPVSSSMVASEPYFGGVRTANPTSTSDVWRAAAPWLAGAYWLGVALMLARLTWAAVKLESNGSGATPVVDGPVAEAFRKLCERWRMRAAPTLAHAERIAVPLVVGLLKPTILLPTTALTGLSIGELELILAHELAHVRRHDVWVNLLQRLAEALCFFNPAAWLLSRRISTLREYCCDEAACSAVADRGEETQLRYATALLRVVELSRGEASNQQLTAVAASGRTPSELRRRVARLFGEPLREPLRLSRSGVLALVFGTALVLCLPPLAESETQGKPAKKPASTRDEKPASTEAQVADVASPAAGVEVDFSGRALDAEGKPVAGATIYLASGNPDVERVAETATDREGAYQFNDLRLLANPNQSGGGFELFGVSKDSALAWKPHLYIQRGTEPRKINWHPSAGVRTELAADQPIRIDLRFEQPQSFRGRLIDHRGEPIMGASVEIRYCDTEWDTQQYNIFSYQGSLNALNEQAIVPPDVKRRETNSEGEFEFTGLPANYRWWLWIQAKGHPTRTIWVVTNDEGTNVGQSADGQTIYRKDFEIVYEEARDVKFRVLLGDTGEPADRFGIAGAGFVVTTDSQGFATTRLPNGSHSISLLPRFQTPYLTTKHQLELSDEADAEAHIYRIDKAAIVNITVVDEATRVPIEGVDVWWDEPSGDGEGANRTERGWRSWEVETRISHYNRPRTDDRGKMQVFFPPGKHLIGVGLDDYPKSYLTGRDRGQIIDCLPGQKTEVTYTLRNANSAKSD
jgi:beta-lactamase regulating signal transducer with metallopeptidase domain/protocatechuate 3,4-dioxygenase beta subunit